jgi:hypothetical protein
MGGAIPCPLNNEGDILVANYNEQVRQIWHSYRQEVSTDPVDLRTVASWAISKRLWAPRPVDLSASLANDLAEALREETRTDKKGRRYRANIPVREYAKGGLPLFRWGDIDDAPRAHVEKSIQQERRSIASDCYALAMKIDHYNDAHPDEEPMPSLFDFTEDVEEMKIAAGLDNDEDGGGGGSGAAEAA